MREPDEPKSAVRPFWSGTITFGLVSIPVELFPAVHARRTSMKMVDAKGRPLGREYDSAKGEALSQDDIVRAYETQSGKMVAVTDEELDAIAPEMSRDIEMRRFVPLDQIGPAYFQRPYLLAPGGRSSKAYYLLAETMKRVGRVGVGTFVMRGHEYLVAILSDSGLLRAQTLRFADELRSPDDVGLPKPQKPTTKRIAKFTDTIESNTRDAVDMDELSDRYAEKLRQLAESKQKKGKDVVDLRGLESEDLETGGAEVVDLMRALRERLAGRKLPRSAARETAPKASHGAAADTKVADLSKNVLYERAQTLHVPGRSRMSKAELARAVQKAAGAR